MSDRRNLHIKGPRHVPGVARVSLRSPFLFADVRQRSRPARGRQSSRFRASSNRFHFRLEFRDFFRQSLLFRGKVDNPVQRNEDLAERCHRDRYTRLCDKFRIDLKRGSIDQTGKHAEVTLPSRFENHSHLLIRRNSILRPQIANHRRRLVHLFRKSDIERI